MREPKLNACRCGSAVEVKYICGLGRGVIEYVDNPFKDSRPVYYIDCPACHRNLRIVINGRTAWRRDKAKRKLIRRWNEAMDGDMIPGYSGRYFEVTK